jgi:hypothetical protein
MTGDLERDYQAAEKRATDVAHGMLVNGLLHHDIRGVEGRLPTAQRLLLHGDDSRTTD